MKNLTKTLVLLMISSMAQAAYEDQFPTYYEYCTSTVLKRKNGKAGGPGGHAFTYIHGLCKDYRSAFPQVIPCSEVSPALKAQYPHEGVGVSVDKSFKNANWVAVPGRDLIINGEMDRKPITNADVDRHVEKVIELKIFDKVYSKSVEEKGIQRNTQDYLTAIAKSTLGTDHAVSWGRNLHCVKAPFHKSSLKGIAQYLNDANNKHKEKENYNWSLFSNNCVHLSLNTSAILGFNDPLFIDQRFIKKWANMAQPANGFLDLADELVVLKMNKKRLKKHLADKYIVPSQVGSLLEVHEVFPTGEFFDNDEVKVLTAPRNRVIQIKQTPFGYEKKYMTPENTNLKANAQMWVKRYEKLLSQLNSSEKGTLIETYLVKQLEISKRILSTEK